MTGQSEPIAAMAIHAFTTYVQRGQRKSKKDQNITVNRGDVVMLHSPAPGQPPFVLRIQGGVETLAYHPGNFIMAANHYTRYAANRNRDNQIVYQDRWFVIFTNLRVMQESLIGLLRSGGDATLHIPLMERIVTNWVYKNQDKITDEMERAWAKYYKLRALWHRPGYPGEGAAAKNKAVGMIKGLIMNHIAPNHQPIKEEEDFA